MDGLRHGDERHRRVRETTVVGRSHPPFDDGTAGAEAICSALASVPNTRANRFAKSSVACPLPAAQSHTVVSRSTCVVREVKGRGIPRAELRIARAKVEK